MGRQQTSFNDTRFTAVLDGVYSSGRTPRKGFSHPPRRVEGLFEQQFDLHPSEKGMGTNFISIVIFKTMKNKWSRLLSLFFLALLFLPSCRRSHPFSNNGRPKR